MIAVAFTGKNPKETDKEQPECGRELQAHGISEPKEESMTNRMKSSVRSSRMRDDKRPMDLAQGVTTVLGENNFREGWGPEHSLDEVRKWSQGRQTGTW